MDKETTIIQSALDGCLYDPPYFMGGDRVATVEASHITITVFTISGFANTEEKNAGTDWGVCADGEDISGLSNIPVTDNIFTFYSQGGVHFYEVSDSLIKDNIFRRETRLVWCDPSGATCGSHINVTRGGSG